MVLSPLVNLVYALPIETGETRAAMHRTPLICAPGMSNGRHAFRLSNPNFIAAMRRRKPNLLAGTARRCAAAYGLVPRTMMFTTDASPAFAVKKTMTALQNRTGQKSVSSEPRESGSGGTLQDKAHRVTRTGF
jgi:hypothetical protein